jgi:WD40 repeat protein
MRLLRVPQGGISALVYGADGHLVTGDNSGRVFLWSPDGSRRQLLHLPRDRSQVLRRPGWITTSADGRVIGIQQRSSVLVGDPLSDQPLKRLSAKGLNGYTAALSADGQSVAAFGYTLLGGRRLGWFDVASGQERVVNRQLGTIRRTAISDDGSLIGVYAAGLLEQGLSVVRTSDGQREFFLHRRVVPRVLQFRPGAQGLLWGIGSVLYEASPLQRTVHARLVPGDKGGRMMIRAAAFSPDGRVAATAGLGALVYLWDVEGGALKFCFDTGFPRVLTLAIAPDGLTMAVGSSNRDVVMYDLDDG